MVDIILDPPVQSPRDIVPQVPLTYLWQHHPQIVHFPLHIPNLPPPPFYLPPYNSERERVHTQTDICVGIATVVFFVWLIYIIVKQEPISPPKIEPFKFTLTMPSLPKIEPFKFSPITLSPLKIEPYKFTPFKLPPLKIEPFKFSPARMPWIKI